MAEVPISCCTVEPFCMFVGIFLLSEIQPQDGVQKAVRQVAQTPGGHQQAACADCQCEHPQARDAAAQSRYTACAAGLGHTDGAVAGTQY